jgi:hypothetical protein
MRLNPFRKRWILILLILFTLGISETSSVNAQTQDLIVAIDRPGEGEHLYAGPSSLLYSIPIAGWVHSSDFSHDEINLKLEIFQGEDIIVETPLRLDSDNQFSIHATVNSESTFDQFSPQHGVFCDSCHHAGTIDLVQPDEKLSP